MLILAGWLFTGEELRAFAIPAEILHVGAT